MKYIRTKDGKVENWNISKKDLDMVEYLSQFANYQGEYAVIAQADTIKELCDRFVYNRTGEYEVYRELETDFKQNDINYIKRGGTIKGAIWTDKGLIYVAKMNDKGELELI